MVNIPPKMGRDCLFLLSIENGPSSKGGRDGSILKMGRVRKWAEIEIGPRCLEIVLSGHHMWWPLKKILKLRWPDIVFESLIDLYGDIWAHIAILCIFLNMTCDDTTCDEIIASRPRVSTCRSITPFWRFINVADLHDLVEQTFRDIINVYRFLPSYFIIHRHTHIVKNLFVTGSVAKAQPSYFQFTSRVTPFTRCSTTWFCYHWAKWFIMVRPCRPLTSLLRKVRTDPVSTLLIE